MTPAAQVRTLQGERWDTLSQRVFGRPDLYRLLWDANAAATLALRYAATLPAGLLLTVPTDAPLPVATADVPPWRR